MPRIGAELLAGVLPFLHLAIAAQMIVSRSPAVFRLGLLLFLIYAAAQATVLWRGLGVSCGCLGPYMGSRPVGASSLALALCGAGLCLLGWRTGDSRATAVTASEPPASALS